MATGQTSARLYSGVCIMHATLVAMATLSARALPPTYPTVPMSGVSGPMEMPLVGLGTWQYNTTVAFDAVNTAFAAGYRHVDTALGCRLCSCNDRALSCSHASLLDFPWLCPRSLER